MLSRRIEKRRRDAILSPASRASGETENDIGEKFPVSPFRLYGKLESWRLSRKPRAFCPNKGTVKVGRKNRWEERKRTRRSFADGFDFR